MTQLWPPSPCVEDEEVALAKEHCLDVPLHQLGSENQPATSRGSVDQYPIILDNHVAAQPCQEKPSGARKSNGVPETKHGEQAVPPAVPPAVTNTETRFVYIPSAQSDDEPVQPTDALHRSKSTTQLPDQDVPRRRPPVTRLKTDLGAGLERFTTGHLRAPSPYAHKSSGLTETFSAGPFPKDNLLSSMHAHEVRRPMSAHPGIPFPERETSDSDQKSKSKRRSERSRSRAARQSFSQSDWSESDKIKRSKSVRRDESPESKFSSRARRYRSPAPSRGGFVGYTYTGQDHITPPQTPKLNSDSARSSALDQTSGAESSSSHHTGKKSTAESPYTSSAEESFSRRYGFGDDRRIAHTGRSRRSSRSRVERGDRPRSDRAVSQRRKHESNREPPSADERSRQDTQTSLSARTPMGMEDFLEKAFIANSNKRGNYDDQHSRPVSPLASPPQSPPRTPRGERASKEYFELPTQSSRPSKHRSRPPSFDDTHFKDIKNVTSLLGAATLGASLAAKALPAFSRPTISQSAETPSFGSLSKPSSGQRSGKPSPVTEEPQAGSPTISRQSSVATRDDGISTRTTTYAVHEERTVQKNTTYAPTPLEPPRAASRASSYSHSPEKPRPPVPYRAFSSASSQGLQQPLHFSTPQNGPSVPANPEPNANLASSISRSHSLPLCPRSRPVSGLHDWYTIRDMSFLDFCPTCMSFLGSTRFRDHFIPSLPKDPRRPTLCTMSVPWLRIAWMQTIKQDRKDLSLVWQIANPPLTTRPCAGSKADMRRWYQLNDPRTRRPVDNFDICSACVRNIDLVFPRLQWQVFDRPSGKAEQEKICNLNANGRHFLPFLNELERLAEGRLKDPIKPRDFQDFVDFVRRISRHRQCMKDTLLATESWHYIPDLPEFTICEECYEEVVWPLRDRHIARDISKTLKVVPKLHRSQLLPGTSCQLYSERMRRIFHEAVGKNDFESLRAAARYRYNMEHRLQEMHKLYEMDQQAGIDRRAEMEKNISIWKSVE